MKLFINKILRKAGKINRPDARDNYLERIELSYLFNIFNLYNEVEYLPGHILELGVGAGRNAIIFGNLLKATGQDATSRYFGFDTFGSYTKRDLELEKSLSREKWENNSLKFVQDRLDRHNLSDVSQLISGDIRDTLPNFISKSHLKKGADTLFCRLIYIDCSAEEPASIALDTLWDHLVPGGIIAVDQRTQGGEWRAAIKFCEKKQITPYSINHFNSAPMYIRKDS